MEYSKLTTTEAKARVNAQDPAADREEFLATLPVALNYLVREAKKFGLQETAHFLMVARSSLPPEKHLN